MAPLPQERDASTSAIQHDILTGEEVVISGISGLFPNSKNVMEFMENLYNKVDMVTKDNPKFEHADLPQYSGKISDVEHFDAQFFRVTHNQADSMEPMGRKLMEQAYGAIYDAGVNPFIYKGARIGVFVAAYNMETSNFSSTYTKKNHFAMAGSSKTMLANRIAFWLDTKGPSFTIDSPSGSMICLDYAMNCIRTGICDAAIVGGCEITNDPILSINMRNASLLCLDGKTKCFNKNGDGSVKSQAVAALFLQKAKDAKRIYAEVCSTGLEYGLKEGSDFNQKREPGEIVEFLNSIYKKSNLSPNKVEYVEAHGAGIPEADANELEAISKVFGKENTVLVGCVKSNMGDSLPVSAICSAIKLCLAYNNGKLPGNLHYDDPIDIPAIQNGNVEVLTCNKTFNRGSTAVNNFSHTGTNCHLVLKGHYKKKDLNFYETNLPHLVFLAGRHEKAIEKIFDVLNNQPIDPEFIGMLNNIYHVETPGFTYRGYTILDTKDTKTISVSKSIEFSNDVRPPLWLLYSGMGSQWAGMGAELMKIPIFASAIEKCHDILKPKGVDIIKIITSPDQTIFDNVLNSFIGIAAVQIGLTNILKQVGLVADNIIGHSVGEVGCSYYDGCFTDEQTILVAYARGIVSIQTELIKGSMAAVGLGYKEMLPLCPPGIEIACHNSSEVCTLSGPADIMKSFVADLKAKGIFAKEVPCGNIAYHSKYIQDAGPGFLKRLKEIIKNPVKRSKNWISSSWPSDKRNDEIAEMSSAEYHTNNLLSPVYFEEAAAIIPKNAVIVEVSPHGLMQAILKRSHPENTHIPLTKRDNGNPVKFLFEAFGKLYQLGYNIQVDVLYPKIEYPVSTDTSPLSHLVEWYHGDNWTLRTKILNEQKITASRKLVVSLQDDDYEFFTGYRRDGNVVLPEAAILFYVWESLAMFKNIDHKYLSIVFHDVHFHSEVVIGWDDLVNLHFCINHGNNYFEVTRDEAIVANGYIYSVNGLTKTNTCNFDKNVSESDKDTNLTSEDIYKIFKIKGCLFQNEFQSIYSANLHQENSKIKTNGNWITFLDSLIQLNMLMRNYDGITVPKIIKSLTIDTTKHIYKTARHDLLNAYFHDDTTICGGIKIDGIIFNDKPIEELVPDIIETRSSINIATEKKFKCECELMNTKPGDIDKLRWAEIETEESNDDLVNVCFASPSMRDVQRAIGITCAKRNYGMDFSGIDSKGNRVMGMVAGGALASTVKPDFDLLWPVPNHWTLEEAATVPLPYVHAFYCLIVRGRLQEGQTVFVTGGCGALGQAVISICLSLGCTIYTSVRDIHKKRFLLKLFPTLNENQIGFSRDCSFYNMVVCNSRNKRCNLVINCATGLVRELVMKCVGFVGHFLDVNDYDMRNNRHLGMLYLDDDKTYMTVDLSCIFKPENIAEKQVLHKVLSEGIANGIVKPLTHVVYSTEHVSKAIRLISQGRNRGRALINISDTLLTNPGIIPRMSCTSKGVYLIVCDETEIGIQLATHLVKRGARNLILNLKKNKTTGFIQTQVTNWNKMGANIKLLFENLENNYNNCAKIIMNDKPLLGIFIITPKIKDYRHSTRTFLFRVTNLDEVTRNNHPELEHFVIIGREDNDQFVNKALEVICESRVKSGLPSLIIRAEFEEDYNETQSAERLIAINAALRAMEISMKQQCVNVFAYNKSRSSNDYVKKIAKIIGIKSMDKMDDKIRVKDVVYDDTNIEELKFAIKTHCKLDFTTSYITEMTIQSLKNLSKIRNRTNTAFDVKLAAFHNFVDENEMTATEIFVPMRTLCTYGEEELNLHAKACNLILIPGFEGHHSIFKTLCNGLKIRATTLQLGPDMSSESIKRIALDLKQRIQKRFTFEPKFFFLGHSFGVNVALEIAALLEEDGLRGTVFCLDSSPDALRVQLDAYLGKISEEQLQIAVIKHLFCLMSGQSIDNIENDLEMAKHWKEKVNVCVEKLKEFVKFSNEYKRDIIETFYRRLILGRRYKPEFMLESEIVLLKGISHPKADKLDDDYALSKYTKKPVQVFSINSDVVLAPYEHRVTNIVNKFLESHCKSCVTI